MPIYIAIDISIKNIFDTDALKRYMWFLLCHRSSGLTSNHRSVNFCEVIADAPQSIESSALRNTFYSKNEYIYIGFLSRIAIKR